MPNPLQTQVEIFPLLFKRKFLLAYETHPQQGGQVSNGYWNHVTGCWALIPEDATAFDTRAGSLVYRRGNLERMQLALHDALAQS